MGEAICDCDVPAVPGCDIRLVVHTVAAGSADAEKPEFLLGAVQQAEVRSVRR
ncbi:hypothetical protein [Streptomyces sp. YU58]|uniref:hypothetical protein n=1 Tax=Streptomyces sp. SX92 TaxID=3158972 RepID=UPI0027BB1C4E|nr:hypothetical protein [Streptomyces coralus]WLW58178.1 hypothetical protein QU709_45460 [Streptomyces coralus]